MSRRRMLAGFATALTLAVASVLLAPTYAASRPDNPPHLARVWKAGRFLSAVTVDADGHLYVTGTQGASFTRQAALVREYGPRGSLLWARAWRPDPGTASGTDVAVGSDGTVYVAGSVNRVHFEGGGMFLRKYGTGGHVLWSRTSKGWRGKNAETAAAVAVGPGMVVVAGYSYGCCGDAYRDGWVRAYDPGGGRLWTSPFETPGIPGTNDLANAVAVGPDGSIYVAGWIAMGSERSETELANHNVFVQKLTPDGAVAWTRIVRDHTVDTDIANGLAVSGTSLFVVAYVNEHRLTGPSGISRGHGWLRRYTEDGRAVWTRTWGTRPAPSVDPAAVAAVGAITEFVTGSRRDRQDHAENLFLRAYGAGGGLRWGVVIDKGTRPIAGYDVAVRGSDVFVAGYVGKESGQPLCGWLGQFRA